MQIKQLYTNCLAQGAYFIESEGEVAIVDPLRETDQYVEMAQKSNGQIKYIFETHFHADFVSGHLSLAEKTGATIVYGPEADPAFEFHSARDGEVFKLGKLSIEVLHTPGHTMESTCYLLKDENQKSHAIFTGDTLFLGDVGRPDLAQKTGEMTTEDLAAKLYDSLREKIMPLSDDILVYPAHGAGSACGKNMMNVTVDTLGNQKKVNYALDSALSKSDFISQLTEGLKAPPAYFPENVNLNKSGYADIHEVMQSSLVYLSPQEFEDRCKKDSCIILDVRSKQDFTSSHLPGSIFIGLDGDFAPWVGAIVKETKSNILLVAPEGREEEALIRLGRVGFDQVHGFLKGGVAAWTDSGRKLSRIQVIEAEHIAEVEGAIYDVRKDGEFDAGHVFNSKHIPLSIVSENIDAFKTTGKKYIYCRSGFRSLVAASLLQKAGLADIVNVNGGYNAIVSKQVCLK